MLFCGKGRKEGTRKKEKGTETWRAAVGTAAPQRAPRSPSPAVPTAGNRKAGATSRPGPLPLAPLGIPPARRRRATVVVAATAAAGASPPPRSALPCPALPGRAEATQAAQPALSCPRTQLRRRG